MAAVGMEMARVLTLSAASAENVAEPTPFCAPGIRMNAGSPVPLVSPSAMM